MLYKNLNIGSNCLWNLLQALCKNFGEVKSTRNNVELNLKMANVAVRLTTYENFRAVKFSGDYSIVTY
jgi:hypothetical protein